MSEILIMNYKTYIVNVPRTQTMEKDSLNKIPTASPNPSKLLPKQTTSEVPLYSMIKTNRLVKSCTYTIYTL